MENQTHQFKKAISQLHFIKLLLSLKDGTVNSSCFSSVSEGKRKVDFSLSLSMEEEFYQLCLDLALQNIITEGEASHD